MEIPYPYPQSLREMDEFNDILVPKEDRYILAVPGRVCCNSGADGCTKCGLAASDFPDYSRDLLLFQLAKAPSVSTWKIGIFGSPAEYDDEGFGLILSTAYDRGIKCIQLESRPELVNIDWLNRVRDNLPEARIEIEIGGTDVWPGRIPDNYLGRHNTAQQFIEAVATVKRAKMIPIAFAALGYPFATSLQAVEVAHETIMHMVGAGVEGFWVEPEYVQRGTLQGMLYAVGLWRSYSFWDARALYLGVKPYLRGAFLRLGSVQCPVPDPDTMLHSCPKCDIEFELAFRKAAQGDYAPLEQIDCDCKEDWEARRDLQLVPHGQEEYWLDCFKRTRTAIGGVK